MITENTITYLWRFFRGVIAATISQLLILQPNWENPAVAFKLLFASFMTGLLMSVSKALRENSEEESVFHKLPV